MNISSECMQQFKYSIDKMSNDVIISFSNSGRNWLFSILTDCGIKFNKTQFLAQREKAIPFNILSKYLIKYATYDRFKDYRVVFLHRDPRDTVVSSYYQSKFRAQGRVDIYGNQLSIGKLNEFVKDPKHGIEKVIVFNLFWKECNIDSIVVSYENMHVDPLSEIKKIYHHWNILISDDEINKAIDNNKFSNAQTREITDDRMIKKGTIPGIKETYKAREGKPNNYMNHMDLDTIIYCNELLEKYNYFERMNG